jgi:hypothetical protein
MIQVGDLVKFPVIYGFRLGRINKIETHRGIHQYEIGPCSENPEPVYAVRWMNPEQFQVISDSDLVLWKLENA